jgi:hypothetical protein
MATTFAQFPVKVLKNPSKEVLSRRLRATPSFISHVMALLVQTILQIAEYTF